MASQVIDPTGGGNTYLGALAMAMAMSIAGSTASSISASSESNSNDILDTLLSTNTNNSTFSDEWRSVLRAAVYATIAASYAIEQCGTPLVATEAAIDDVWNGESFQSRLERYLVREEGKLISGIRQLGQ